MEERIMTFDWNLLAFLVFPYLSLAVFVVAHAYRYFADPFHWNARSSELLEKESLRWPSLIFHYGVIFTFVGHFGGLIIPQTVYDQFGIDGQAHTRIAGVLGMLFGVAALLGSGWLLWRRLTRKRLLATSSVMDVVTSLMLLLVIGMGAYNALFGHYYVLDTIAPWIRSIVTFTPKPRLMGDVPWTYQIHILLAFGLFALSPFTRLIHIWSVPVPYILRSHLLFRKRCPDPCQTPRPVRP
jgi:nitrate reductase gamma subunit